MPSIAVQSEPNSANKIQSKNTSVIGMQIKSSEKENQKAVETDDNNNYDGTQYTNTTSMDGNTNITDNNTVYTDNKNVYMYYSDE